MEKGSFCMKKNLMNHHLVLGVLGTLLAGGTLCPSVYGAERTLPLTVTGKNQAVTDDFNVTVTDGLHDAALDIPASASGTGGVIQVGSGRIVGNFTQPADEEIMEANGVYIHGDYTGTVQFADGLQVSTTAAGRNFNADGIYLTGVEDSYDSQGNITLEKTAKVNAAYEKNGRIADAYGIVGKDTTLTLVSNPVQGKFLDLAGLESHFAHMEAGDGLNISVTSGPAARMYAMAVDAMFYGKIKLGNQNTFTVSAVADDSTTDAQIDAIYSSHDHPYDEPEQGIARQRVDVGDDTTLNATLTSSRSNQSTIQVHGAFLDQTDFSFGDRLTINTQMTGSGKLGDGTDSVASGMLVWTSQGTIGDDFRDTVTFSDGAVNRVQGVKVNGLDSESDLSQGTSLAIGKNSRVQLDLSRGTLEKGVMGYQVVDGAALRLDNQAEVGVSLKDSQIAGEAEGMNVFGPASLEAGDNAAIRLQMENSQVKEAYGLRVSSLGTLGLGKYASVALQMENSPVDTVMGINVDRAKATLGDHASLSIAADGNSAAAEGQGIWGINASDAGTLEVGNGYRGDIKIAKNPVGVELVNASEGSRITMGSDARETLQVADSQGGVLGRDVIGQSTLTVGDRSHLTLQVYGEGNMSRRAVTGTAINGQSTVVLGNQGSQDLVLEGVAARVFANQVRGQSTLTVGNGHRNTIRIHGTAGGAYANYLYAQDGPSQMTLGDGGVESLSLEGTAGSLVGNSAVNSSLTVGNGHTTILTVTGKDSAASTIAGDELAVAPAAGINLKTGSGYATIIRAEGNNGNVNGMYAVSGAKAQVGDGAVIDIQDRYTGKQQNAVLFGIRNQNAEVSYGSHLRETLAGENVGGAYGIVSTGAQSRTQVGDDALLQVDASGKNTFGVYALAGGTVDFTGGTAIQMGQDQDAICSTGEGSSVSALGAGRKVILGNLEAADKGSIRLNLNTGDSLFRGKSTVKGFEANKENVHGPVAAAADASAPGVTELTLANGARWDMTDSSQVTGLDHANGGLVNMEYNPEYQRLDVGTYSGQNGIFRMKTDLDSETNGDKVYMTGAAAGSHGLVQVHDESFLLGKEVTGTKHLLLITDDSKKASFSGQSLDEGGLWDVTPTIQNGSYVRDTMGVADARDTEWYLTKLTKTINRDTRPLIAAADSQYGLYRESLDTLRQRMGDLRFLKKKDRAAGLWARMRDGEFSGADSLDTRYHSFQLGYDQAANPKTVYGVLAERGIASPSYAYGSGKDHSLAGALYGTWFGDNGSYTDVVARYNRDDAHISTYGGYPDRADWRSHDISASVEYGRTIPVSDNGYFVEPQAQFQMGHLGSYHATTLRGKTVQADGYDSAIGRIGFVAGRRGKDARHPFDWYIKGSLLHEFGGSRALRFTAPNGESLDTHLDSQGTWCTLGLGGTYRTSHRTYLYGDVERSFGGDLQKKWQVNVGVQYQF